MRFLIPSASFPGQTYIKKTPEHFRWCDTPEYSPISSSHNMSDSNELDFKLYRYTPAIAPAALFVALFALTTLCHTYQVIRGRAWYFIAFVIGGICK